MHARTADRDEDDDGIKSISSEDESHCYDVSAKASRTSQQLPLYVWYASHTNAMTMGSVVIPMPIHANAVNTPIYRF